MAYEVIWHEKVLKDLKTLSRQDSARITAKVKTHLAEDPAGLGKPLSGVFKGLMRYRVGSHRVIYTVDHENHRISVLYVKPRDAAYRRQARTA
ncbi:MAG: type II toxin-antitoxin system RelE/ParE family toxin [Acidobacteria bacterium]|nr:type II toxin-antitoxin system RelE/ParE family toxin [Acidobacteriota bacterium]